MRGFAIAANRRCSANARPPLGRGPPAHSAIARGSVRPSRRGQTTDQSVVLGEREESERGWERIWTLAEAGNR